MCDVCFILISIFESKLNFIVSAFFAWQILGIPQTILGPYMISTLPLWGDRREVGTARSGSTLLCAVKTLQVRSP